MLNSEGTQLLATARALLAHRLSFDEFLAKLSPKDRASAERRVLVLDAEPANNGRALLWRRLACSLMTLAPHAAKLVGKQSLQVYVADGKYRMQVFALEDLQDGNFSLYCRDVLDDAVQSGLLAPTEDLDPDIYLTAAGKERLRVERLDGKSINPVAHVKDLTGWNRKALRITLHPSPSEEQIESAELLCAIAAQHYRGSAGGITSSSSRETPGRSTT